MKKSIILFIVVLTAGQVSAQTSNAVKQDTIKPSATLDVLIRRLPNISVDANGNITYKGKRVDKVLPDGSFIIANPLDSGKTLKAAIIKMDCRDYVTEYITKLNPITPVTVADRINEVDDYGDQVPHFAINYPGGVYVSRSFGRNVAEAWVKQ
jgi:hypothetical protein